MSHLKFQTIATGLRQPLQQGFTLLELLVVVGLLSILAVGAATMLADEGDWQRTEETPKRWDVIRKSILGEPNMVVNGTPYISGYAIDMGRLPISVPELIMQNVQFDNNNDNINDTLCEFDHDNNAGTAQITLQQPAYTEIEIANYTPATGFINTVGGGWRGPYVYTAGSRFYGDGWFNQNTENPCTFSWVMTPTPTPTTADLSDIRNLQLVSLGSDRVVGGEEVASDYPNGNINLVNANEWTLAGPISVNIQFNRAVTDGVGGSHDDTPDLLPVPTADSPHQLQLVFYRYIDNGNATASFTEDVEDIPSTTTFSLSAGITVAPAQTINLAGLPIGRYAAVIWCTFNTPADATDDRVYDGDCDGGSIEHSPVYFTLTQSTSQVTIVWNLP